MFLIDSLPTVQTLIATAVTPTAVTPTTATIIPRYIVRVFRYLLIVLLVQ